MQRNTSHNFARHIYTLVLLCAFAFLSLIVATPHALAIDDHYVLPGAETLPAAEGASSGGPAVYTPFVKLDGFDYADGTFADLVNQLYFYAIAIGATLGVIRIALAGLRHSMSDVVTTKTDARDEIKKVFFGLFILFLPALVLGTINSDLLKLDPFARFGELISSSGIDASGNSGESGSLGPEFGKRSCTVGSSIPQSTASTVVSGAACVAAGVLCAPIGASVLCCIGGYWASTSAAPDNTHTDASCRAALGCGNPGDSLDLVGTNKYVCTYRKEEQVATQACNPPAAALRPGETVEQVCVERCNGLSGTIGADGTTCEYTTYVEPGNRGVARVGEDNEAIQVAITKQPSACGADPATVWVDNYYGSSRGTNADVSVCLPRSRIEDQADCEVSQFDENHYECFNRFRPGRQVDVVQRAGMDSRCVFGVIQDTNLGQEFRCNDDPR